MNKTVNEYYTLSSWEDMTKAISVFHVSSSILHAVSKLATTASFEDCLCKGQLVSKSWVVDIGVGLDLFANKNISVCGGWYGLLSAYIFSYALPNKIESIDIDPLCEDIANTINQPQYLSGNFEAITKNMIDTEYKDCDVIINTSFEHLDCVDEWLETISKYKGKYVLVQSTDNLEPLDHINCCNSHDELADSMKFNELLYAGTMEFPHYKRFMTIGKY